MPYSVEEFKRLGLYVPKPEEVDVLNTSNGESVGVSLNDLPKTQRDSLRKRLIDACPGKDQSAVDCGIFRSMFEQGMTRKAAVEAFTSSKRGQSALERHSSSWIERTVDEAIRFVAKRGDKMKLRRTVIDADESSDWRKEFKSKNQLCRDAPRYVIQNLVPEKALTMITAPSFHGKSWIALHLARAISEGKKIWGFDGPRRPIPFRYHVPEMNESMVRQRMEMLHFSDSDMFLVRAMESGAVWALDDERMLASSRGAVVCLDTTGYFNDADDTSSYQQAIKFGEAVFNLLTAGGALAVIGLYHPPKYSLKETTMTLENMLLGSAGYGGLLRSCLGVRNLNSDPNEEDLWLYVQGLKNPRLKPFQLGGLPLTLRSKPGESPYLSAIAGTKRFNQKKDRDQQVRELLAQGQSVRSIAEKLGMSHNTIKKIRDENDAD